MKKNLSKVLIAAAAGALLSGCGYFKQFDNFDNAAKLRVGMTKEQVKQIMGDPENEVFCKPDLWYYYISTQWHDGLVTRDECMPLVFVNGKLAGWGNDYYNRVYLVERRYKMPVIDGINNKSSEEHPAVKVPVSKNGKKKAAPKKPSGITVGITQEESDHPDIKPVD